MSVSPEQKDQLRSMIATMLMVSPSEITDSTSLATLNTSLGAAKVRLGLKRLSLAVPVGTKPATFGGLVAALSGEAATSEAQAPSTAAAKPSIAPANAASGSASSGTLQVGVDVEEIDSLPIATDYWEHEFYQGSFSKSEIAYAVVQTEPRIHFAGFWCAKEALRKCDSAFKEISPADTAVAHDAEGRPYLTQPGFLGPERLPHAVSISHTTAVATSVVVTGFAAPEVVVETITPQLEAAVEAATPEKKKSRGLAKLFGI
jgi:phosphopantetheine--protein transferase-like protein